jgi:DNA repair protein RadC
MTHYQIAKEEFAFYGQEGVHLQNLLAILIGPQAEPAVTGQLAALGIKGLNRLSREELMMYACIDEDAAERILAALSMGILFSKFQREERVAIHSPRDAYKLLKDMAPLEQEHFEVLYLNTKNEVLARRNLFKGTIHSCFVHPREIFREAYKVGAASFICAHNHPSGDPSPSEADIWLTRRLLECGETLQISLKDHIIIGQGCFFSMKEKGYLSKI